MKDPRWADIKLGGVSSLMPIKEFGCLLCSLSMVINSPPNVLNEYLIKHGCFNNDTELDLAKASPFLNLVYKKQEIKPVGIDCIAETNHYWKLGYPKHFFVLLKDGNRVDPLDYPAKEEANNYHVVSYRVFTKNGNNSGLG
jgi:hypothetical protein